MLDRTDGGDEGKAYEAGVFDGKQRVLRAVSSWFDTITSADFCVDEARRLVYLALRDSMWKHVQQKLSEPERKIELEDF